MTMEMYIEIPANHRLTLEVPREVPAGQAIIAFTTPVKMDQAALEEGYRAMAADVEQEKEAREWLSGSFGPIGSTE